MTLIIKNLTTGFRYEQHGLDQATINRTISEISAGKEPDHRLIFWVDTGYVPDWAKREAARARRRLPLSIEPGRVEL